MRSLALVLALGALATFPALSACKSAPPEAIASAQAWLKLVDSGQYADSYTEASTPFRAKMTSEQWQTMVAGVRSPFGRVLSRSLKLAIPMKEPEPGAPPGEYVMIEFDTAFEHRAGAVERVTPVKEADGRWHVSGYYIR